MSRRRLPTDLPPNFRYPLMTPDNDRESFADYDLYDGDAGRSREPLVYPNYQPRERSPAPQVVRVAKQPEMIRRQSLRPFSGDWGTADAVNVAGDSKVPGSFQDTDAEGRATEILDAVPRGAYSHPIDSADFYTDESDENLDFGHEEPLIFPRLTLEEVVQEVAHILRTRSKPASEGFTYVFADPTGHNRFYKIGSAKNVSTRANDHRKICNISYFRAQKKPATPLWQYKRLEKLAQAELINMSYDPNCICGIQQRQYFWGRAETAFETIEFWSKWLLKHSPYDKSGRLLPFWEYRLRVFEAKIQKNFDCQGAKCMKHSADVIACPICLRAGWKAWTEPSGLDKIEFVSRTQIGSPWVHKILLYLYKYIPIQDSVWVTSIDGLARAVSLCDRFKSPAILLNLLYARLLIPMLWSTIFTTAEYFSFFAIMEILVFSAIYQLVRLELAQLGVHRRGTERLSKDSRQIRRKALPPSSDRAVDEASCRKHSKEPRILEIPDDEDGDILHQAPSSGGGGQKIRQAPVFLPPSEAATRLKRFQPVLKAQGYLIGGKCLCLHLRLLMSLFCGHEGFVSGRSRSLTGTFLLSSSSFTSCFLVRYCSGSLL
ncbi:GIY-YIG nuclease family protein [Aspergillus nidulans FGSC A4]|uniref:Bacteriophage T5 Orf172 DNA-binding domain-containing protein n=1 Tax=Emericella nidulans (strain FGSC A4 / ATCC 38163 / CBS 112.46 / NRRL 194 / M139) TaxID=227321 RepID=C8VM03_EMENI|nr:hypothetical protein [Aspergillus nidulans FGSC A4]CBF86220.1 TPA: hypothetical protein ANIA_11867 [Aspergillus nidulans FGSC A4]